MQLPRHLTTNFYYVGKLILTSSSQLRKGTISSTLVTLQVSLYSDQIYYCMTTELADSSNTKSTYYLPLVILIRFFSDKFNIKRKILKHNHSSLFPKFTPIVISTALNSVLSC